MSPRIHDAPDAPTATRLPRRRFAQLFAVIGASVGGATLAACAAPATSTQAPPPPTSQPATSQSTPQQPASPAAKPTQAPPKLDAVSLKIGVPAIAYQNVPVHLGAEKGFFKEQMLDLEIVSMDATATIVKALIAREVQVAEMDAAAQISAIANGAAARIIGAIRVKQQYVMAAKNSINSVKDLVGKNLAVSQPNSAPNIVTELLLRAEGIDPGSVTQVAIGSSANRARAIITGTVDATVFGVDEIDKIEADPNVKILLFVKDILPKYVGGGVIAHNDVLAKAGVAERLMEAMTKSTRYCFDHKDECVEFAVQRTGNSREASAKTWDYFTQIPIWEPNAVISAEQIDYMQDVNVGLKTQPKKLPAGEIADMSYADRVIARIGRYTPKPA